MICDLLICGWEFIPSQDNKQQSWKLSISYMGDSDGHCITDVFEPQDWMFKKVYRNEDDFDLVPIMGRAITSWDIRNGIRLFRFHPPEWAPWLSCNFYEELCLSRDWPGWIEQGHQLYFGTEREVKKMMGGGVKT